MERVLELTELVLDDRERWNQESIARVLDNGQTRNVTLSKKIPVLLAYWTAWVDPQGRTNFRRDIYGQDAQWAQALDADFNLRSKPLFSPSDGESRTPGATMRRRPNVAFTAFRLRPGTMVSTSLPS